MEMGITGNGIFFAIPFLPGHQRFLSLLRHIVNASEVTVVGSFRIMEFMTANALRLIGGQNRSRPDRRFHISETLQTIAHGKIKGEKSRQIILSVFKGHGTSEIDQTAAFGIAGQTVF